MMKRMKRCWLWVGVSGSVLADAAADNVADKGQDIMDAGEQRKSPEAILAWNEQLNHKREVLCLVLVDENYGSLDSLEKLKEMFRW